MKDSLRVHSHHNHFLSFNVSNAEQLKSFSNKMYQGKRKLLSLHFRTVVRRVGHSVLQESAQDFNKLDDYQSVDVVCLYSEKLNEALTSNLKLASQV